MPLYDYACTQCGKVHEVRHGFGESHDQPCEACGAPLRRVFNPAPVLFKGSGFYVTDSRRSSGAGKAEKAKEEPSTASAAKTDPPASGDATGAPKPDAKASEPAA
jgi:putative FmdB family regulatory protein